MHMYIQIDKKDVQTCFDYELAVLLKSVLNYKYKCNEINIGYDYDIIWVSLQFRMLSSLC